MRDEAVAEVVKRRLTNPRDRTIFRSVAMQFDVGEQSLRLWVKASPGQSAVWDKSDVAEGGELDADSAALNLMKVEIERLKKKIDRLHAENDVLKKAFVVFSSSWGRDEI